MKKIMFALMTGFLLMFSSVAMAEESSKPNVAVVYVNHAETTFDDAIDQYMKEELAKYIPAGAYNYIDGSSVAVQLNYMGITDISSAERSDITQCLEGTDVDYVVYLEIQPMVRKEKVHFFDYGIEMTTQIPLKIIDVVNNKYLYTGKLVEKGEDSTIIGGLGNKSSVMDALKKANVRIQAILESRLPAHKAVPDNKNKPAA